MVITDIKKTKRGRYSLYIDGEFRFSVHKDTYLFSSLTVGTMLGEEALAELMERDEAYSSRDKAMSLLAYSSHSRGMLVEKLRRHYSPEAAEAAADRMAELGLLDDRDYGLRFGSDLMNLRGWSLRRVEQELLRKRLDRETVATVMEELRDRDETGDPDRILALIRKRYHRKLEDERGVANTIAALQRQGFSLGDIRDALRQWQEETE